MAETGFRAKLGDILNSVSWGHIAMDYFGKSPSWLYHKLDAIDGNGSEDGFTDEEKLQLQDALRDLANRIKIVADSL